MIAFILILLAYLCKLFYDFKILVGFNYPLLIKIINIFMDIFILEMIFHFSEVQTALKQTISQTKMED
jgi:hypothetical protein